MPPSGQPPRWRAIVIPIALVMAALAAYANSFDGAFILDDFGDIVTNSRIREVDVALLGERRPLVLLSLALNFAAGGLDPWGYHAVNLVIHVLAGLALFGIARRTLRRLDGFADGADLVAGAIGLLWLVHPLQTQAVTYIVQRGESMMGLFYLLAVYAFIRGTEARRPLGWFVVAVLACGCAMSSKVVAMSAPIVILLYDRAFVARTFAGALRARGAVHAALLATAILVLVTTGVAADVFMPGTYDYTVGFGYKGATPLAYALTQPGVIAHYLRLVFWPFPQNLDPDWPLAASASDVVLPALALLVALAATGWALVARPAVGTVAAAFFAVLAPTSSFVPVKDAAFEHRMYLPLAAVAALVVCGGWSWLRRVGPTRVGATARAALGMVLVAAAAAGLAWRTHDRNIDYRNPVNMWLDVVRQSPHNMRAYNEFGNALQMAREYDTAVKVYDRGLARDDTIAPLHANRGRALAALGRHAEAIDAYETALALDRTSISVHTGLAESYIAQRRLPESEAAWRTAIGIDPDHPPALHGLGRVLCRQHRFDEAIAPLTRAVELAPTSARIRVQLGHAYLGAGRTDAAITIYRQATEIDPNDQAAARALRLAESN